MTGSKSKNSINQMKFFFSRAKFRAFTDAMLANDEQEWNISSIIPKLGNIFLC
jgi:hypothetical protein